MKTKNFYSKEPMVWRSVRVKQADLELLRAAALKTKESQSEFLRAAIRDRAVNILAEAAK
jgi:hypothetical protein